MEAYLNRYIKCSKILPTLMMVLMLSMLFSACQKELTSNSVRCSSDGCLVYPKVAEQILPSFIIEQANNNPYYHLEDGAATEAFDTQAVGALESGIAKNWYPHYLATVIIAVDRDQTDVEISGWNDLYTTQEEVSFLHTPGNTQMLMAAMSYGLEGKDYGLAKATQLLASLHEADLLKTNTFDSPIIICYDCRAAALVENGRNIEMIIPKEGTFTYEKGLLSNENLVFEGDIDDILLASKLRLLDGTSAPYVYPNAALYKPAVRVSDYKHFAKNTQQTNRLFERNVLGSKIYMSIDHFEHLLFALVYIIITTIWIGLIIRRSMQKGVSYAAFATGIILIGWIFVRLIKYQIELSPTLTRYLWYGFYLFQLTLPLVLLWMAWAIDKPENDILPPKWWKNMAIVVSLLIVLVFTNDLHGLVLDLDLSKLDWDINYGYGLGYYVILFVCMVNLLAVFVILIKKSLRNPRKKRMILPPFIFFLFALYNYKYIMRDPFVYATDLTIVTGIFTMLMFESCIHSGMIPSNSKYIQLFVRSPLEMQIINQNGEVVLASEAVIPLDQETLGMVLGASPLSISQDNDTVLFANPIPGGHTVWCEDVSKLFQLHREIKQSSQMLTEANAILLEEKRLKRSINQAKAKKELMEQLEVEIAQSIEKLTHMIQVLPDCKECSLETTRIALLLCYIKRRCDLFFKEKETNMTTAKELIVWIDELAEIAKHSNVHLARVNEIEGNIHIRYGTLLYDFFYGVVDLALQTACSYIIGHLEVYDQEFIMRLLPAKNIGILESQSDIFVAIGAEKGKITVKELDDTVGITISFPKGGGPYE